MHNKISLNINHRNSRRMEFFLNRVMEKLTEIPFEWQTLKLADCISGGRKFKSDTKAPITITVLLCDSYQDCVEIAKANSFPELPTARWSLNGDLLYIVESIDQEKVSSVLSLFAGEE